MTLLCIIPGPNKELLRRPDRVRWCFTCHKHLPHDLVMLGDEDPSYYDPITIRQCSGCGHDDTDFPGTYREYER